MNKTVITLPWPAPSKEEEDEVKRQEILYTFKLDDFKSVPDYFNLQSGKINKEAIGKLSYSHLENAYRYWHYKREKYLKGSPNPSSKMILILSVLVASLKKELGKREKDIPEV